MPRTAPTFKFLCAPGHAPDVWPSTVAEAEQTGADAIAWSEAYRESDNLLNRPKYRAVIGRSDVNTRAVSSPHGDAGDNPVSVAWGLPIDRRVVTKVDDPGKPAKFAPERWLYEVDVVWQGKVVTIISAHPSPLFVGRLKWAKVMREVRKAIRRAQARGNAVILAGDLQTGGRLVRYYMRGLGMKAWVVGVVWVAWSGLEQVDGRTLQPKGMDHQWMLATFKLRP
jgi:hypothetical protein